MIYDKVTKFLIFLLPTTGNEHRSVHCCLPYILSISSSVKKTKKRDHYCTWRLGCVIAFLYSGHAVQHQKRSISVLQMLVRKICYFRFSNCFVI